MNNKDMIKAGHSSYDLLQGDLPGTLRLIADRYIADHPPQPFVFRVSQTDGLRRGEDYRYELNMAERFPEMKDGQWIYAWAKVWCGQEAEWPFRASFFGPTWIYCNGQQAYRSNIEEEVFPGRRSWFRLKLAQGWNHLVLRFMKTGTGCGARFGTGSIKGLPLHVVWPTEERGGGEGWMYTRPLDRELDAIPHAGMTEAASGTEWLPHRQWPAAEQEKSVFERLFGQEEGFAAYGWTSVRVPVLSSGEAAVMEGRYWGGLTVYIDGTVVFASNGGSGDPPVEASASSSARFSIAVPSREDGEARQLVIRSVCGANGWGIALDAPPSGMELASPFPVEGGPEPWLYLGRFRCGEEPVFDTLFERYRLHKAADGSTFWRIDHPSAFLRPFAETTHYGRWNYPLGVTLYGLIATGITLGREDYSEYASGHIEQCTASDEYALWDREIYGAPGINHQLAFIDTLDDCGSFGSAMLHAMRQRPLAGGRAAADRIAHYISEVQDRLPDGALYRVRGSTDFMQDTMWCDDLYMSTPFLVRYYELTCDEACLNDAASQFLLYRKYLYMPEQSIMSHVYDLKFGKQNGVPWGRGNGWVLFSLAELLGVMPKTHEKRRELLSFFQDLCAGYAALQGKRGLWHQVLDDPESYEETSCTAMFVYAFAKGARNGWLTDPGDYANAARRGWAGITRRAVDNEGNVYGVCRGSGYSYSRLYYKDDLTWNLNDTHGIGIVLLAGTETWKLSESGVNACNEGRKERDSASMA